MKYVLLILTIVIVPFSSVAQPRKKETKIAPTPQKSIVIVRLTDDGPTSELPLVRVGRSANLTGAEFGAMYFGPQNEKDISLILLLKGTKNRYTTEDTLGVIIMANGIALKQGKARQITSVDKEDGGELLHFHITIEELAWLASARTLSMVTLNVDTDKKYDTLVLTGASITEFKKFAESVYLIRSHFNAENAVDPAKPASLWKLLHTDESKWFYRDYSTKPNGDIDVWLKIVPPSPQRFKTFTYGWRLAFTTFHCNEQRFSVDPATAYSTTGEVITKFPQRIIRERVEPDSNYEVLFRKFCQSKL